VARFGTPLSVIVDKGSQFTPSLWKELTNFLGCELIHTTSYNSKANGLLERCHRVLKASIKAQTYPQNWYSNHGWILVGISPLYAMT